MKALATAVIVLGGLVGVGLAVGGVLHGQDARPGAPGGLSREEAEEALAEAWAARAKALAAELQDEDEAEAFELEGRRLRVKQTRAGALEWGERSLWISLHGGGRAEPSVNNSKWADQLQLYRPTEGIYVAPRAPTDTWNLWHQSHVDALVERMIASYVTRHGVDPDRVYLMGYSAGGDGVYQLGPRMADRFAAASAMAGHPNDARPEGLRNLPFGVFVGAEDDAFDRAELAQEWGARLDELREEDPGGYAHVLRVYPGKGHWMDGKEREALAWMAEHRRDPWPERVVWIQDDVTRERMYWLELADAGDARRGARVEAEVEGQTIRVTRADGVDRVALRLRDELVDLDRPVVVEWCGEEVHRGRVDRSRGAIERSLRQRADPGTAATARLVVSAP